MFVDIRNLTRQQVNEAYRRGFKAGISAKTQLAAVVAVWDAEPNAGLGGFLAGNGKPDLLLSNLRTIGTHHCDQTVGEEAAQEIERMREANAEMQKQIARAWNDGFDFAMKGCGWQEGEDPSTEGMYVARDSKGNIEVGMWYAKTTSGQPAEWSKEFRDVDRDNIVAWMMVPPNAAPQPPGEPGTTGYWTDERSY